MTFGSDDSEFGCCSSKQRKIVWVKDGEAYQKLLLSIQNMLWFGDTLLSLVSAVC